jgi:transcriptional regulator with XRE-family HTH domain
MKRPGDAKRFGARVRARRKELGLTQTELAVKTGISQQNIYNIEHGKVERTRRLKELAAALQMPQDELLGEQAADTPPESADEPLAFIARAWSILPDDIKLRIVGEVANEVVKMKQNKPA